MEKDKWHKNWFSNMLPLDNAFEHRGISYKTVENFYQAQKIPKENIELRKYIAGLHPIKSKKEIRNHTWRADWTKEMSVSVMEFALRRKFFPGTTWNNRLMETGLEEIVEWNNWGDTWWGRDLKTGIGENYLGRILMHLRDEYRSTIVTNKSVDNSGISIMRGTIFGNPYTHIKDQKTLAEHIVDSRDDSITQFKVYFLKKISVDKSFKRATLQLKNEKLKCCCAPLACHGDVIRDWLFLQNSFKYE